MISERSRCSWCRRATASAASTGPQRPPRAGSCCASAASAARNHPADDREGTETDTACTGTADTFIRHYEDAAQIIRAVDRLPDLPMTPAELAADMVLQKDIAALPSPDEPALLLADTEKRAQIELAHRRIAPIFWGQRTSIGDACAVIREWLGEFVPGS